MMFRILKDRKAKYLKEFNSNKNGPLHDQDWFKEGFIKYHEEMAALKQLYCSNCTEMWPSKINYCIQCNVDSVKFSKENDMVPDLDNSPLEIKRHLENLTMIEGIVISPILSVMSVYKLPHVALICRGFIANFAQDITELTKTLPRLPKNLPILILKKKDLTNNYKQFVVNRKRVETLLNWLCKNNPQYIANGIKMNNNLINLLPEIAIPKDLYEIVNDENNHINSDSGPEINEKENFDVDDAEDFYQQAFIENNQNQKLQSDLIEFPKANIVPIKEYECGAMCSLLFPKRFPTGKADPTKTSKIKFNFQFK
jgi:hypothetical protein